jgi:TIR domain
MTYQYEFDNRNLGDIAFETETYGLIQQGLAELKQEVDTWNEKARAAGATPPYERESRDLEGMIAFGSEQLSRKVPVVRIRGISVGSMRYYRAGLELILRRKRIEIEKNRKDGWPSGVLESLRKALEKVEKSASQLNVPPADLLWEVLSERESGQLTQQLRTESKETLWDAFISHASEDNESFVRPLAEALQVADLRIWYDEFSLRVGDSLRRSIDKGLSRARYGIVVFSPYFFAKEWPQKELDGLVAREIAGQKVILPVWHNVDRDDVCRFSPTLVDRVATLSQKGMQRVVQDLLAVIKPGK